MARYSCVTELIGPSEQLNDEIRQLLQRCHLNILHITPDYWIAGEPPGQTPFNKLVTVEVLMDRKHQGNRVAVTCIAKNQELPLKSINHCQQTFHQLKSEFDLLQTQLAVATTPQGHV